MPYFQKKFLLYIFFTFWAFMHTDIGTEVVLLLYTFDLFNFCNDLLYTLVSISICCDLIVTPSVSIHCTAH